MTEPITLPGCRHDVLGHALKAIGVLRALSKCADDENCDPSIEGFWDANNGLFTIQSQKYSTVADVIDFFAREYAPIPLFGAWTTGWGYQSKSKRKVKTVDKTIPKKFRDKFQLPTNCSSGVWTKPLKNGAKLVVRCPMHAKDKAKLEACFDDPKWNDFITAVFDASTNIEPDESALDSLHNEQRAKLPSSHQHSIAEELRWHIRRKRIPEGNTDAKRRERRKQLNQLLLDARAHFPDEVIEEFAAISVPLRHPWNPSLLGAAPKVQDNPLFGDRGQIGRANIFRQFWACFYAMSGNPECEKLIRASLLGDRVTGLPRISAGTLFFPETIKRYNHGLRYVNEEPAYSPLDYLLAVEGLFCIRGSVARSLIPTAPRYAAYPFIFESLEECRDNEGKPKGLSNDFFFPIWNRSMAYDELKATFALFEARLGGRLVSNSTDFMRAFRSVASDLGIDGFQQFRIGQFGDKSQLCRTGVTIHTGGDPRQLGLRSLLAPLDQSRFLGQFPYSRDNEKRPNLHPDRLPVLRAIELAAANAHSSNFLQILLELANLNSRLAISKSFRKAVSRAHGRKEDDATVSFVPPFPQADWESALAELRSDPEFEVARALASVVGNRRNRDSRSYYSVEPFLGSMLPLHRVGDSWQRWDALSDYHKLGQPTGQAVATGTDLCLDLTNILGRRYQDSMDDDYPALRSRHIASLSSILRFIRGELNEQRIARLTLALSHIGWDFTKRSDESQGETESKDKVRDPIPMAYAACRTLIEIACESKSTNTSGEQSRGPANRSPEAISLICQRTPATVARGVDAALRRLAIVGVPNRYSERSRLEKKRLTGRDVISPRCGAALRLDPDFCHRLAAAALIPLDCRDTWKIYRSVTIPQSDR